MVLKSRLEAPDWSAGHNPAKEAKCRKFPLPTKHEVTKDNDPWFEDEEEATHICNGTWDNYVCPFRERCLHIALVNNEQAGMFGGFTVQQRRWIRRNRDLIDRTEWPNSESWRDQVPPPEYFEEGEDAVIDEEAEAEE